MKTLLFCFLIFISLIASAEKKEDKRSKSRFEQLELFNKVLYQVESSYYRSVDTEKLIEGAIKGMMQTLDPHSAYLNKDVFEKMQSDTKGEFTGIGIEVTEKDGYLIVVTPIEDKPAFKAGIKPGDKIVEINHESTIGLSLTDAIEKMRGKKNSKLNLGVKRENKDGIMYFTIMRETIKIDPVKYTLINKNYGFIRLKQFQKNSAQDVRKAYKRLKSKSKKHGGLKGIILDLRFNPGGLLDEAVEVASIFLKGGVVVSTEGRDPKNKEILYVNKKGEKILDIPVAVLINGSSASASEIVAGALQDLKRAIVLGTQSFGKGSVQTVSKLNNEVGIKLTIRQYMTPNNRKIQAVGIKPDIELADIDIDVFEENKIQHNFVREKDLRNHLMATIESKEEMKTRLEEERLQRITRIHDFKTRQEKLKNKKSDANTSYDPKNDYQVLEAVKILKSHNIYKVKI